jgi:hypothetical protein
MVSDTNSTWMTPSASQNMNTVTFPADWHTKIFFYSCRRSAFPLHSSFSYVLLSEMVHASLNGLQKLTSLFQPLMLGIKKKSSKFCFYALLSHIWYTMCMDFATSMLFMDMVLTITIENSSVADTQFFWFANHAHNCLFHTHLQSTDIIASIYLTTVFCICVTSKQVT